MKKNLLWVGDAVCDSGFALCTHRTVGSEAIQDEYNISVLGINYRGDPHKYPYPVYPAMYGGDYLGYRRIKDLAAKTKADIIVLQNDPWNIPGYLRALNGEFGGPIVGTLAVDSNNCRALKYGLNYLTRSLFWTEFGRKEAIKGGLTAPSGVVGLGVDLEIFKPGNRLEARKALGLPETLDNGDPGPCREDAYIIGNVNRNQPRKRLDLTIRYFAEWVRKFDIKNAFLYLHVCPTGDTGIDCNQLANWYGIPGRLILAEPDVWKGASQEMVVKTYQAFNGQINTALGEGWGLTALEGMACGVWQIGPDVAAFGPDGWPGDAMVRLPYEECVFSSPTNQIGGVMDRVSAIETLQRLYTSGFDQWELREKGLALVAEDRFRWDTIGQAFAAELRQAFTDHDEVQARRVPGDAGQGHAPGQAVSR